MPQVLKDEVRERILGAGLDAFANHGFAGATMSGIAQRAGMAVANLYRYYASKDELFEAAVPRRLALDFERLLEQSARAHAHQAAPGRASDTAAAGRLLDFWIAHRRETVILLDRAGGTIHDGFARRFVDRLVSVSIAEIRAENPGAVVSKETRLVLTQVFENTRRMIGAILESCDDERAIRAAVAIFRRYQVAGLAALASGVAAGKTA